MYYYENSFMGYLSSIEKNDLKKGFLRESTSRIAARAKMKIQTFLALG